MECFLSGNEINVVNEELDGFDAHTRAENCINQVFFILFYFSN